MNSNITKQTKKQIYKSNIMKYVSKEKIKKALENISENDSIHNNIYNVLSYLSTQIDENNNIIKKGIETSENYQFSKILNKGCTDYLASKISGENSEKYPQCNELFSKLEPMLIKHTGNEDILTEIYLNNEVELIKDICNNYISKGTFENIYHNFLFMEKEEIDEIINEMNKYEEVKLEIINQRSIIKIIMQKIRNLFVRKEQKSLNEL